MTRKWCAPSALVTLFIVGLGGLAQAEDSPKQALFEEDGQNAQNAAVLGDLKESIDLAGCNSCNGDAYASDVFASDPCGCDPCGCDPCGCDPCGCDPCGCDPCGGGGCGLGGACKPQFVFGADYLYVRASFSQAVSYLTQDVANSAFVYNQFDFDYNSSYRFYGGYKLCECGYEVRFTYSHFKSDGSFQSPDVPSGGAELYISPGEVITNGPGDSVSGTAFVELDTYDLACSKTIPLGSPLGASCGDCCDPCGCWCPAWDITWSGGVRVATVDSELRWANNIVSTPSVANRTAYSRMKFEGGGLRAGAMGRRYFGKSGIASVFVKGDISLLLGDVDYEISGPDSTVFSRHSQSTTQIVPVTEIEAGATVMLTRHTQFTAGYLFAAWHDLGHRAEYDFGATGVQIESLDDANILGLDGLFARLEVTF